MLVNALKEALAQPAPVPLTDDVLQKIISNLEPLLDAKNQSWSQAEKMLIGILGEQPPQRTEQEPVAWRDVIAVNLVREGINKHRARELAEHFIKLTTPPAQPQRKPLTDEEFATCIYMSCSIEAKLKEKI
jgi:hypothetical protein